MKITLIDRMQNGNAVCHVYNGLTQDFIGTIRKLKVGNQWTNEEKIFNTKLQAAKSLFAKKGG